MRFAEDCLCLWGARFVFGLLFLLIALTFRHYGVSWDEEIQSQYGQAVYDYYNSGFVDHRYNQLFNLYLYGGMFDGLAAFFDAWTPLGLYATRHFLNALFGLFGLWGTWRLGGLIGGRRTGLAAIILLALTPMYYGHMFNNPKDIPFAAGVMWTLYYMGKTLRAFPHVSWRLVGKLGLFLGLTLGARVGGVMLLGYWGMVLAGHVLYRHSRSLSWHEAGMMIGKMARVAIPVALLAYIVMLICWPWAQEAPFVNPLLALKQFSNFPQDVEVLLDGTITRSTELPWFYVPLYFAVQLPLLQLVLFGMGIVLFPRIWRNLETRSQRSTLVLLLLAAFVPVLYAVTHHPALYDAVRHFLFVVPLLCILAALALGRLFVLSRSRAARFLLFGLLAYGAAMPVMAMIRLHPYEYIYINPLQGGVKGAFGKYELDYWGSSFKEAAEKLQKIVQSEGGVPAGKIYRVAICGPWSSAMIYLPPDYEPVMAAEPAEFFLSTTRWMCQNMREGREIVRVERMGAPLSIIKDLR